MLATEDADLRSISVAKSVLEAIQSGQWDFEPEDSQSRDDQFSATNALPGTDEKLEVLSERIRRGLPLWHPDDRHTYDHLTSDAKPEEWLA